jgi:hypothetical protein
MVWGIGTVGYGVLAFILLGLLVRKPGAQAVGQSPRTPALRRPIE